jgi:hypothetical protein
MLKSKCLFLATVFPYVDFQRIKTIKFSIVPAAFLIFYALKKGSLLKNSVGLRACVESSSILNRAISNLLKALCLITTILSYQGPERQ